MNVTKFIWSGEVFMESKVSKIILEYIDEQDCKQDIKDFLKEILEYEILNQIIYEETDSKGQKNYSKKYMNLISDYCR